MAKEQKISIPLFLLDSLIVNLSFVLAFMVCFKALPKINVDFYLSSQLTITLLSGVIFWMFDLHSNWKRKGIHDLVVSILLSILTLSLILMACTFPNNGFPFPHMVILIAACPQLVGITLSRSLVWYISKRIHGKKRVLIIAQDIEEGSKLAQKILQHSKGWFIIGGCLSVSKLSELEANLETMDVVLINANIPQRTEIVTICAQAGIEILMVPEVMELFLWRSEPQQVDDMLVLSIKPQDLNFRQLFVKRFFDIIASAVLLLLFSSLMMVLYIAIPLSTKGPALYRQERVGKNKEKYLIYKFRSMIHDAEELCGPALATDNDPRITKMGKFMRSTRLDELPQLINVLKGNMSLVGPRPERLFFVHQYEASIPLYSYRMSMKPGITGMAQVMGMYSTTAEDKLRFDLLYMNSYSFALDLKILLQTILVVLKREQAGGVRANAKTIEELT